MTVVLKRGIPILVGEEIRGKISEGVSEDRGASVSGAETIEGAKTRTVPVSATTEPPPSITVKHVGVGDIGNFRTEVAESVSKRRGSAREAGVSVVPIRICSGTEVTKPQLDQEIFNEI